MEHTLRFENEIQQKPPHPDDTWAEYEYTGRSTVTCSCGYDSGLIPSSDVIRLASGHVGFDITTSPTWTP